MIFAIYKDIEGVLHINMNTTKETFKIDYNVDYNTKDPDEALSKMAFVRDNEILNTETIEDADRMVIIEGNLITDQIKELLHGCDNDCK